MNSKLQESFWRGFSLPADLGHISTKQPNAFTLYSEISDIDKYLGVLSSKVQELKVLAGDCDEKTLEKTAPRLRYNPRVLERLGGHVLGKREENDAEALVRFYQECGIDVQGKELERRSATPGGKEDWADDKPRRKDQLRKFDPRIRGMVRLVEQVGSNADLVKLSYTLLGENYKQQLFSLSDLVDQKAFPRELLPNEDTIERTISDFLKSKKAQDRSAKLLEKLGAEKVDSQDLELLGDNLVHIYRNLNANSNK